MSNKISAKLLPLEGKYYSTRVEIYLNKKGVGMIEVGVSSEYCPSDRELNGYGLTREDWDNNVEVENSWGYKVPLQSSDHWDGSHYENQTSYLIAKAIEEKLNE